MSNPKENFIKYLKFKKLRIQKTMKETGLNYGNYKGDAKNKSLNSSDLAKIVAKFKEINPRWLLTGEGEMLESKFNNQNNYQDEIIQILKKQLDEKDKHIDKLFSIISGFENKKIKM